MSHGRPSNALCIELLGGFRISYGSDEIRDDGWRLAKARSLVKIIALQQDNSILREQLVELLWPELDPDSGSNNLHQALHVARRTLGSLIPDAKPNELLRLRRGFLSLEPPAPVWVDLTCFEEQVHDLAESRDPAAFYGALDLYRGDLLPDDLYEDWAFERRLAVREQYLALLDRLSRLHIARQEAMPAIDALRRVVAIEPDQEEAHRALMELYALTGRRQQALRQYERLRDILERELDLEPEPETDELYAAIQSGEFPSETWEIESPELTTQPARPEITESIADFLQRVGDFVGRADELATLQQALEGVIGGRGAIILVAGEPGIGKTRMTEEFLRYANAQGVRTLWGRCYEGEGAPAYWPWVQIIRSFIESRSTAELRSVMGAGAADIARIAPEVRNYLPDLEDPPQLDPDGERFRLFDSLTTFLKNAAGRAPLALIIDDLHTADRSSLLLLEFLAREIAETGLLVIGTYRHVEVDRSHPLTRTLGQLARQDITERITLEGLTPSHIDHYINLITGRDAPEGLAGAIHEQTEGNPFFVREIVHLLIDEERLDNPDDVRSWRLTIPPGIRETIALRTARLSETAHKVLTTASVSGRDFELPIVAQVAGLDEMDTLDGLEEALRSGLVNESPVTAGGFRFAHAITRETLYEELSEARRLRMHLRTGEVLEKLPDEQIASRLAELAYHFPIAASLGSVEQAIKYLRLVGVESLKAVAFSEAVHVFERALELARRYRPDDSDRECHILLELAQAEMMEGNTELALQHYRQAAELARSLANAELFGNAVVGLSSAGMSIDLWNREALALLEDATTLSQDRTDVTRVQLLTNLSRLLEDDPESLERREDLTTEALRVAHATTDPLAVANALYAKLRISWMRTEPEARIAIATEIAEYARRGGDQSLMAWGIWWRIYCRHDLSDVEGAATDFNIFERLARQLRSPRYLWQIEAYRAAESIACGVHDQSAELIERALLIGQRPLPGPSQATHFVHRFALHRSQGTLQHIVEESRQLRERHADFPIFACILVDVLAQAGELAQAEDLLLSIMDESWTVLRQQDVLWPPCLALLAEAVFTLDVEAATVLKLQDALTPFLERSIIVPELIWLGSAAHFSGMLAAKLSEVQLAEDRLRRATCQNARMGLRGLADESQRLRELIIRSQHNGKRRGVSHFCVR